MRHIIYSTLLFVSVRTNTIKLFLGYLYPTLLYRFIYPIHNSHDFSSYVKFLSPNTIYLDHMRYTQNTYLITDCYCFFFCPTPIKYNKTFALYLNRAKAIFVLCDAYEFCAVYADGMGGFYEPHFDHSNRRSHPDGERLATFMIYLNTVKQGGITAFPRLGVGVEPRIGDAVFWFNLQPSGMGDDLTLHGACPVVHGAKWGKLNNTLELKDLCLLFFSTTALIRQPLCLSCCSISYNWHLLADRIHSNI